jgi:hypothetical protein
VQASLQAGISFNGVEILTHLNGLSAGGTMSGAQFAASAAGTAIGVLTGGVALGDCVEDYADLMDASMMGVVDREIGRISNWMIVRLMMECLACKIYSQATIETLPLKINCYVHPERSEGSHKCIKGFFIT